MSRAFWLNLIPWPMCNGYQHQGRIISTTVWTISRTLVLIATIVLVPLTNTLYCWGSSDSGNACPSGGMALMTAVTFLPYFGLVIIGAIDAELIEWRRAKKVPPRTAFALVVGLTLYGMIIAQLAYSLSDSTQRLSPFFEDTTASLNVAIGTFLTFIVIPPAAMYFLGIGRFELALVPLGLFVVLFISTSVYYGSFATSPTVGPYILPTPTPTAVPRNQFDRKIRNVRMNRSISLKINEVVRVPGNDQLVMAFAGFPEDALCPPGNECVDLGAGKILVQFALKSNEGIAMTQRTMDVGGLEIAVPTFSISDIDMSGHFVRATKISPELKSPGLARSSYETNFVFGVNHE